jgi:hypothetical protein
VSNGVPSRHPTWPFFNEMLFVKECDTRCHPLVSSRDPISSVPHPFRRR